MTVLGEIVNAFFDGVEERKLTTLYSKDRILGQLKFTDHTPNRMDRDHIPYLATVRLTYESGRHNPGIVYLEQIVWLNPSALWVADFASKTNLELRHPPANELSDVADTYNIKDAIRLDLISRLRRGERLVLVDDPALTPHIESSRVQISFNHPRQSNALGLYAYMDAKGSCKYPVGASAEIYYPKKGIRLKGIGLLQQPPINSEKPSFRSVMDFFLDIASGMHAQGLAEAVAIVQQLESELAQH